MDELIKAVRTFRLATNLSLRLSLTDQIIRMIERDMSLFIFRTIGPPDGEDVTQNTLNSIVTSLGNFKGESDKEFWAWCYTIASNKRNDYFRQKASGKEDLMAQDLWELVELSASDHARITPGERLDLQYVMDMLGDTNSDCADVLWQHYIFGLKYAEIAAAQNMSYDSVRMKIGRCLDEARKIANQRT